MLRWQQHKVCTQYYYHGHYYSKKETLVFPNHTGPQDGNEPSLLPLARCQITIRDQGYGASALRQLTPLLLLVLTVPTLGGMARLSVGLYTEMIYPTTVITVPNVERLHWSIPTETVNRHLHHYPTLMVLSRRPLTILRSSYWRQYTPLLVSLWQWMRCSKCWPVRQLFSMCYTSTDTKITHRMTSVQTQFQGPQHTFHARNDIDTVLL